AEEQQLIVQLTQHLFELIAREAPTLQKVMPVGAIFGINIAPEHLHSDSFKEYMHRLRDALPAHHFHIVLEITERDMIQQYEAAKLFEWLHSAG
ncbi:EAL domain-containing protein, partial [Salmonella enterica]|uniref:EAL domain-containing protein n=1 Tax=Salmonella enterica TaxID=28901 RepID=UPI0020C1E1BF